MWRGNSCENACSKTRSKRGAHVARNPGGILDCPRCPKQLRYVTTRHETGTNKSQSLKTVRDVHIFECASHGRFRKGQNGRLIATD